MLNPRNYSSLLTLCFLSTLAMAKTPELTANVYCETAQASWKKDPDALSYVLSWRGENDALWQEWSAPQDTLQLTVPLNQGDRYDVRLKTRYANGDSEFSKTQTLRIGQQLPPPIVSSQILGTQINISWNSIPGARFYIMYYSFDGAKNFNNLIIEARSGLVSFDLGNNWELGWVLNNTLTVNLWEGIISKVAMVAEQVDRPFDYNFSPISNVITIATGTQPQLIGDYRDTLTPPDNYEAVHPAQADSPYKSVLESCVFSQNLEQSCTLNTLPFLGLDNPTPKVDDIMRRTLVSHDWMAQRFRQVLSQLPEKALLLFRPLTAVVIGSHIRPAHYDSRTGAIYIDPEYLWQNPEEKNTIDPTPDFRSHCGDFQNFLEAFIYERDGYRFASRRSTQTQRNEEQVLALMSDLLFHELTHSNDFFPPSTLAALPRELNIHALSELNTPQRVSYQLNNSIGLLSEMLKYQAIIQNRCESATCEQTQFSAESMGKEFALEGANDLYSYFNEREDTAMLAEETLMRYFYGARRWYAFADQSQVEKPTLKDLTLRWGQIGRIAEAQVKTRGKFVMSKILPEIDFAAFLDSLPPPENLENGRNYDVPYKIFGSRLTAEPWDSMNSVNSHSFE